MIFFMVILLTTFSIIWGISQLNNHEKKLQIRLDNLNRQIFQIRQLSNEWSQLQQKLIAPLMPHSLSSFVENIARSIGIQDNLQLNDLTNVKKGMAGIKVGLDSLKLDHLLLMLFKLENHRPVLNISNLSITISPSERKIRASFHVKKQKNY